MSADTTHTFTDAVDRVRAGDLDAGDAQASASGVRGARVAFVIPGNFDTGVEALKKDHGASGFLEVAAVKRFGRPEEIASVLAFSAGSGPGYLTGTDILLDGGSRAGAEFTRAR